MFLCRKSLGICEKRANFAAMNEIVSHIEYLLRHHDCVVVPGWGAFIAHTSEASFLPNGTIAAPYRSISYNESVVHSDGLLANSVMRREGISYDAAMRFIQNRVEGLKQQLRHDEVLTLGRVGTFKMEGENVVFYPLPIFAASAFYGLQPFTLQPIEQIATPQESEPVTSRRVNWRNIGRAAASIAALVALTFVLSTPVQIDKAQQFASIDSALKIKSAQPRTIVELRQKGDLTIALPKEPADTVAKANAKPADPTFVLQNSDRGGYYLVVASFDTDAQVRKYLAQHPGVDLRVLNRDGHLRVYACRGSWNAMTAARPHVTPQFPGAWVCK